MLWSETRILISFIFGLVLGSFLNVCIYRLPRGESIINPPSSCPECGLRIRFYDNIPLISYMILLGRCRHCRSPIPFRYPVVELIAGLLSAALFIKYGLSPTYFLFLAFAGSLVVVTFIDLQHKIIPDVISLPGILVGVVISFFDLGNVFWRDSLLGMVAGGGFLFLVGLLFKWFTGKEGMGFGDVKLLAMIGSWMGWRPLPYIVLISSLTGTLVGGASLLLAGQGMREKIPFGPFLVLGALTFFFFETELVDWYSRFMW
jgi:leader peptidase (prepilin peptidase)/N-methyltransferase